MMITIKQRVTVQSGGRIELACPALMPGVQANVIVSQAERQKKTAKANAVSDAKLRKGRKMLCRFKGAVDSANPRAADNEGIDADLAQQYSRGL